MRWSLNDVVTNPANASTKITSEDHPRRRHKMDHRSAVLNSLVNCNNCTTMIIRRHYRNTEICAEQARGRPLLCYILVAPSCSCQCSFAEWFPFPFWIYCSNHFGTFFEIKYVAIEKPLMQTSPILYILLTVVILRYYSCLQYYLLVSILKCFEYWSWSYSWSI